MRFTQLQDFLVPSDCQALALGAQRIIELPTDAPIETIGVMLTFTPTAVMATDTCDGIQNILQNVTLETYGPEGVTPVVNISGAGLIELNAQEHGALDSGVIAALGVDDTAAKTITYWIDCPHPRLSDLISPAYLLPAQLMTKPPTLKITLATQAQMDTNATPTFAISAGVNVTILVNRRYVNTRDFRYLRWDIQEAPKLFASSGNEQRLYLDPPGYAASVLLRGYTAANTRGNPLANSLAIRLMNNGVQERRITLDLLRRLCDRTRVNLEDTDTLFANSWMWNFINDRSLGAEAFELGSLCDLNIPEESGRKAFFVFDVTGGAGVQFKTTVRRLFDLPGGK